jgi:anionic cell wall polymer biosynthesis LytR-Cps2A-Psr (LCP) family protein
MLSLGAQAIGVVSPSAGLDRDGNGRVTVLLVGSDYRSTTVGTGERTDMMMMLTVRNKVISAASLPRDVGAVPICNGVIFKPKVNGLFKYFKQNSGLTGTAARNDALEKMRQAFECAFKIKIDYVVYMRFTAVDRLVDEVDGVYTAIPREYRDGHINDERTANPKGAKFLQATSVLMKGSSAPLCYTVGRPINWNASPNCTRALLWGRSRSGPGNNDWVRARHQQNFVFDAIRRVTGRGSGSNLSSLQSAATSNGSDFYTTIPMAYAVALFNTLNGATMPNKVVFKPNKWAYNGSGSKQLLKIDVVRARMQEWFGSI